MTAAPQQWGKYRINRLIAKGGMAEVYEAEVVGPAGFAKKVCLKRIRPELSVDESFVRMFEAEARIAARLQHNNIVSVFDFDHLDGRMFLTMEYVDGCDLKEIILESTKAGLRLPPGFAVSAMDGLLAALDHAHTSRESGELRPVIHRDVSPHNVLISQDGTVKLADFGIAKSRGGSHATQAGIIKGKLAYLAPEQLDGEVSPATDLFAAGLVFYETFTGTRLLRVKDSVAFAAKLAAFEYKSVPWLSDSINGFLSQLLARKPADRFPSADAARNALHRLNIPMFTGKETAVVVESTRCLSRLRTEAEQNAAAEVPRISLLETRFSPAKPMSNDNNRSNSPKSISPAVGSPSRPLINRIAATAAAITALVVAGLLGAYVSDRLKTPAPNPVTETTPMPPERSAIGPASPIPTERKHPLSPETGSPPSAIQPSDSKQDDIATKVIRLEAPPPAPEEKPPAPPRENRRASAHKTAGATENRAGILNVNVRPWAEIWIDGASKGTTPIQNLSLPVGRHRMRIENKPLGYSETLRIAIRNGKPTVINRTLSK